MVKIYSILKVLLDSSVYVTIFYYDFFSWYHLISKPLSFPAKNPPSRLDATRHIFHFHFHWTLASFLETEIVLLLQLYASLSFTTMASIKVGDTMPSGSFGIMKDGQPGSISTEDLFSGKKVALFSELSLCQVVYGLSWSRIYSQYLFSIFFCVHIP